MSERTFHLTVDTDALDGTSVVIHDGAGAEPLVAVTRTSPERAMYAALDQLLDAIERSDAVENESAAAVAPCSRVRARSGLASVPEPSALANGLAEGRPDIADDPTAVAGVTRGGQGRDSAAVPLRANRGAPSTPLPKGAK